MVLLGTMKKNKHKIEYILVNYPDSRNNDALLTKLYWEQFDGVRNLDDMVSATPSASIERVRRAFTNKRKYLPTDEKVWKARKIAGEFVRQNIHTL